MIAIHKSRYFNSIICLLPVFILLLTSCNNPERAPLRIASSPWPGYEPLYLARDLGYFNNDTIKLFELPSADITFESFRNHSADLASLTLDETIKLLHDGKKIRILLVLDISNGGDAVLAKPSIKSLPDIKGKRISIVNIPLGLYMLSRTLDHAGLERKDVTIFPMSENKQERFYIEDKADVIITFEPVKTKLIEAGAHVLFDSSNIPNEVFDLLIVHEDVYQERRDELCDLANGWFKSLQYIQHQPDDAASRITKRLGVNKSSFKDMMDGIISPDISDNKRILAGNNPEIKAPANKLTHIMLEEKLLTNQVDISTAIDPSFSNCY